MRKHKIAKILDLANRMYAKKENFLDGMTKSKAQKVVRDILLSTTKGFHNDDSWIPIHRMFEELDKNNINYELIETKYGIQKTTKDMYKEKDFTTIPNDYKKWFFEIYFTDNNNKKQTLYGNVTANGAGSTKDPLSRYDVTGNIY